jgi:ERCC4-type nuclease
MIHDIFSTKQKKQIKEENKIKVIADIHEKNSLVIPTLIELGAEVESKSLEIGDYLINNIAIERKSASDFISSMLSKRLQEQLNQIQQYEKKLFIIEGELNTSEFKIHPNAIKGQIIAILTYYNLPIIFTKNAEDTAHYLFILAKQQLNGVVESSLHARKPKTASEQKQYIIEAFPEIGPKNAEQLLKKFKSIKKIINAKPKELEKEIGKKAESIINLRD